jgi:sialic acid synthase SpsE
VRGVRLVESMLGDGHKAPTASEQTVRGLVRKSLTTCRAIQKGERFTAQNLTIKRPGTRPRGRARRASGRAPARGSG